MSKYFYPLSENGIRDNDIYSAVKVLKTKQITMSKETRNFEKYFSKKINSKYSLMVNSGSSANLLSIFCAGNIKRSNRLKPGDEILVPILCWPTTIWPIIQFGAKPVFVDIDKKNLNVPLENYKKKITKKTKGIFLINVLGISENLDEISIFAKKNNLILFEDNCESLGAKYNNKYMGTFGDFSSFSFFYSHQITSGEGGMVCCKNKNDYEILFELRSHGWHGGAMSYNRDLQLYKKIIKKNKSLNPKYIFTNSGFNLRPTDIQAAIGMSQFKSLNLFKKNRTHNKNKICNNLISHKKWNQQFDFILHENAVDPSYMCLPMLLAKKFIIKKNKFLNYLEKKGIETRPIISGSFNNQPAYKLYKLDKYNQKFFKNSQEVQDRGFVIGLHKDKLSDKKLNFLVNSLMDIDNI